MLIFFKGQTMKTIKVILQGDRFMAYFSDDQLLLPTPFSPRSRSEQEVISILRAKNPDYMVISG